MHETKDLFFFRSLTEELRYLRSAVSVSTNWYDVLLGRIGLRQRPIINFKNGLRFYYEHNRFPIDVFTEEPYRRLDVVGREIVDVGAFIGDSAMYFAMRGAKHVYAYEPMMKSYRTALDNLTLNKFNNISIFNAAVAARDGSIEIDAQEDSTGSTILTAKAGVHIPVISLESIVKKYDLKDAALKLDCEGAEFPILLDTPDDIVNAFNQIILEYHSNPSSLIKRLKKLDYLVTIFEQIIFENGRRGLFVAEKLSRKQNLQARPDINGVIRYPKL